MLSILPTPTTDIMKEIESILYTFVWSHKPERIKRKVLIGPVSQGGLKMIDIFKQNISLKIAWVQRWLNITNNQSSWKNLAMEYFQPIGDVLWDCNLCEKDINCAMKNKYKKYKYFWFDVMSAWCKVHYHVPVNKQQILAQIIWLNSHIRVGGSPCFYKNWSRAGVNQISDLMDINNCLIKYDEFCNRYHIAVNHVTFQGLLDAIPIEWKTVLKSGLQEEPEHKAIYTVDLISSKKATSFVYNYLVSTNSIMPRHAFRKWNEELHVAYDDNQWSDMFTRLNKITKSTRMKSFQFRLYHRILPTNVHLCKWKIKDNESCTFCKVYKETYLHLFIDCDIVKQVWKDIGIWLRQITGTFIMLDKPQIILGLEEEVKITYMDMVLIVFKQYVYFCRCRNMCPNVHGFTSRLFCVRDTEKLNATINKNMARFERKWLELK